MNIRERRAIHESATRALDRAPQARQIILVYAAVVCGLSLLSTVISVMLSDRISGAGGLSNIGLRSVLSTGQSVLPLINFIITACLSLGYHTAILSFTAATMHLPEPSPALFAIWDLSSGQSCSG